MEVEATRDVVFDAQLQPISAIKGVWDVTTADGDGSFQILFEESGLSLIRNSRYYRFADFDFDGATIIVDGSLGNTDVHLGSISATFVLNESGDMLSGTMRTNAFSGDCCYGGVTATRSEF